MRERREKCMGCFVLSPRPTTTCERVHIVWGNANAAKGSCPTRKQDREREREREINCEMILPPLAGLFLYAGL